MSLAVVSIRPLGNLVAGLLLVCLAILAEPQAQAETKGAGRAQPAVTTGQPPDFAKIKESMVKNGQSQVDLFEQVKTCYLGAAGAAKDNKLCIELRPKFSQFVEMQLASARSRLNCAKSETSLDAFSKCQTKAMTEFMEKNRPKPAK